MRRDIETYIHDMYTAEKYKLAKEGIIYPIPRPETKLNALLFFSNLQERAR